MGLPFTVVQGTIFIADSSGNIVDTIQVGDGKDRLTTQAVIQGGNLDAGQYRNADVVLKSGRHALVTDATVSVEQVFGQDNFADTWFFVQAAGADGDTLTVTIAAGTSDPTTPDRDPPAYSKVVTVTAAEVGDEIKLRDKIVAELNADVLFSAHWKATVIKDNTGVHISSKYIGEFGERTAALSFNVVTTGTTTVFFENSSNFTIIRRGKKNSGVRDPRDKRLVTVGISGEVQAVPGAVGDLFIANALNGSSPSMTVNGSITPVDFIIPADAAKDIFVEEIRFYGNANGIKFGQFLAQNNFLTNGISITVRSDELQTTLPPIKSTDDFKHKFAFGSGQGFQLHIQAGRDDFMASFKFSATFPIRKAGTFVGGDDFIRVRIQDNLLSGVQVLEFAAIGFKKEV